MSQTDRAQLLAELSFDHRASIVRFLTERADKHEEIGRRSEATILRAEISNIAAMLDIEAGRHGIASPVTAIIRQTCTAFGGETCFEEVIGNAMGSRAAQRVRQAAMWVAKKRLGWSDEAMEADFRRERSSICSGIARAEERRAIDAQFRALTDGLLDHDYRCENCQHPFVHVRPLA